MSSLSEPAGTAGSTTMPDGEPHSTWIAAPAGPVGSAGILAHRVPSLRLAAIARWYGFPRPAWGERAARAERKPELGLVRGRLHKLRLAERPPDGDVHAADLGRLERV